MWIISILILIFILGIIILVHEFGHFIWAKKFKVHIYEFSIGMGPIIHTHKGKDKIDYNIRAFPIGGFVSMAGEVYEDADEKIKKEDYMCNKPWWQRLIILVAGVVNNFILAIVLLFISSLIWGGTTLKPVVKNAVENYPMAEAGIKSGDTIAVPNDASNESRALYVLKNAGLIGLSVSGDTLATVKDINSNPKNLVIKELDAAQTPRALDSITAAVINDDFATTAKLTVEESIYTEPVNKDSEQWINIIVANKKDANNKIYKEVVKAYQTEATKKAIEKAYPDKRKIAAWGLKLD